MLADNDYAVGQVVATVAASTYASNTLIFVIEDDAQDGPDHVSAHRSTMYVAGPYVKQGALVHTPYNTISVVKTIEQVLALNPLGVYDNLAAPMSDVFDTTLSPSSFKFTAAPSNYLLVATTLFPSGAGAHLDRATRKSLLAELKRTHDAAYWEKVMKGQNFDREDALDVDRYNRALWKGLMGSAPYPSPVLRPEAEARFDVDDPAPWCGLLPDGRIHS
jgi:hypothetical protein